MIKDQRILAAEKACAKIAEIERQATSDLPGGAASLAQLSDETRERTMSALVDKPTFNLWRSLRMTLSELLR
jgi:hypothetical protein